MLRVHAAAYIGLVCRRFLISDLCVSQASHIGLLVFSSHEQALFLFLQDMIRVHAAAYIGLMCVTVFFSLFSFLQYMFLVLFVAYIGFVFFMLLISDLCVSQVFHFVLLFRS